MRVHETLVGLGKKVTPVSDAQGALDGRHNQ